MRAEVAVAISRKKSVSPVGKIGIWNCTAVLFAQVPKKCTVPDLSFLYIFLLKRQGTFARKNNFLALGICFPQT